VEAAKRVPYRRPMSGAVKLLSRVYSIPAAEEKDSDLMYSIYGAHGTFNIRYVSNL
jgi:hypothetical protein